MIQAVAKLVPDWLIAKLINPSIRYSSHNLAFQRLFTPSNREMMLRIVMEYVAYSRLEGDYLEFGVFEGQNFANAYHLAQLHRLETMRFYAFDSFDGLPEIRGVDASGFRNFVAGEFRCGEKTFRKNLRRYQMDLQKVSIVAGWFDRTLNEDTKKRLSIKKAAVIFIDCDLYESVVPVLEFIADYVQEGTVVVFDDWFCFRGDPDRGEQRAFREWLERKPRFKAIEFQKLGWQAAYILRPSS